MVHQDLNYIVKSGLNDGDVIVIEGASKLKDDMEIVPQQAGKDFDKQGKILCKLR